MPGSRSQSQSQHCDSPTSNGADLDLYIHNSKIFHAQWLWPAQGLLPCKSAQKRKPIPQTLLAGDVKYKKITEYHCIVNVPCWTLQNRFGKGKQGITLMHLTYAPRLWIIESCNPCSMWCEPMSWVCNGWGAVNHISLARRRLWTDLHLGTLQRLHMDDLAVQLLLCCCCYLCTSRLSCH